MNKENWSIIVSAVILAFCLCTEDENPISGDSAGEQFLGSWKGDTLHTIVLDTLNNVLSDTAMFTIIYYNITPDEIHFYTQIEDSCTNTAGPYTYTTKGDTLYYTIPGGIGMNWEAKVTIRNDSLFHIHQTALMDSTGQEIGVIAVTATYGTYENTVPESWWPTDACPLF